MGEPEDAAPVAECPFTAVLKAGSTKNTAAIDRLKLTRSLVCQCGYDFDPAKKKFVGGFKPRNNEMSVHERICDSREMSFTEEKDFEGLEPSGEGVVDTCKWDPAKEICTLAAFVGVSADSPTPVSVTPTQTGGDPQSLPPQVATGGDIYDGNPPDDF